MRVVINEAEFRHGSEQRKIHILPGMTATAEIKSRERSVLSYLTKPIQRAFSQSMGER